MKSGVRKTGEGFGPRRAIMEQFLEDTVKVGIPESRNGPHGTSGLSVADLATIHEFGLPEHGIPERSFLRAGIEENLTAIKTENADLARLAVNKKIGVGTAQKRIGQFAVDFVKDKLVNGPFVALNPRTVRAKGHDHPLIETGQLHDAIGFEVSKK